VSGVDLSGLVSVDQLVEQASRTTDPAIHTWADAAAGQEVTASRNVAALNELALVPRVLVDVGEVDISSSFVGVPLEMPVVMAPVGALSLYHRDGALGAARAAADAGTSSICSMLVSEPWEELAATAPGRQFFQLYVGGDRSWTAEVITRVEAAAFAGIVVTADSPVIGRRDRALASGFTWSVHTHEAQQNLDRHGFDMDFRRRVTWADLDWICAHTGLPVVLKGVLSRSDARRAVEGGARGIYVSNHGGRVLDQSISTIEVLAEIVEEVGPSVDVVVDSGFARGADVCKALALGARAVGLGRLQCWALAVGGRAGVAKLLQLLREEIEISMANLGCPRVAELRPEHVRWSIAARPGPLSVRPGHR
jgi:isopentenyl diphosphate isomerase/L-lactate dehydrogenase-like FMN-dependent dehydrogenase